MFPTSVNIEGAIPNLSKLSIAQIPSTTLSTDQLTQEDCDRFQKCLTPESIDSIWDKFRNFTSESGKVSRRVFIQALNASSLPVKNDKLF